MHDHRLTRISQIKRSKLEFLRATHLNSPIGDMGKTVTRIQYMHYEIVIG